VCNHKFKYQSFWQAVSVPEEQLTPLLPPLTMIPHQWLKYKSKSLIMPGSNIRVFSYKLCTSTRFYSNCISYTVHVQYFLHNGIYQFPLWLESNLPNIFSKFHDFWGTYYFNARCNIYTRVSSLVNVYTDRTILTPHLVHFSTDSATVHVTANFQCMGNS
jgi:hypothetical protein